MEIQLVPVSSSKMEVEATAKAVISKVESGEIDPVKLRVYLKTLSEVISNVQSATEEIQLREAQKYGEKRFSLMGAEIEIKELGSKYDFTNCNDPVWNKLSEEIEALNVKKKDREKFLKAITKPMDLVIEETGEIAKVNPPVKSSKTGLQVTLK